MSNIGYIIFLAGFVLMIGLLAIWAIHYDKTHAID